MSTLITSLKVDLNHEAHSAKNKYCTPASRNSALYIYGYDSNLERAMCKSASALHVEMGMCGYIS